LTYKTSSEGSSCVGISEAKVFISLRYMNELVNIRVST
jgi:hypothetical protein